MEAEQKVCCFLRSVPAQHTEPSSLSQQPLQAGECSQSSQQAYG
ncbi:hypothetical protein [Acinetobacter baumannii]|nr:hypothetical protein [Acinetobacter baumannii]WFT02256.1 hypothetical protein MTS08_11990 [Acinetobacter baumannii]